MHKAFKLPAHKVHLLHFLIDLPIFYRYKISQFHDTLSSQVHCTLILYTILVHHHDSLFDNKFDSTSFSFSKFFSFSLQQSKPILQNSFDTLLFHN